VAPHADRRAQGGVASPRGSTVCLPPWDRRMAEEGFRRTRGADAVVVRGQTREEAQRAVAIAARVLREALGVERQAQKTRLVHVSQGVECLGDTVQPGPGPRRPASKRRGRSHPQHLEASPRAKSGPRCQEQIRSLTRRQAPLKRREVIARRNPVSRGWGHCSRQAEVTRLFPRLDRWIAPRLDACLAKRWRTPLGRQDPTRRLSAELGWGRLTPLLPGLVRRGLQGGAAEESGVRENGTSRLIERTEAGPSRPTSSDSTSSTQAKLVRYPKAERRGNREAEPQRGWAAGPNGAPRGA
jgi:RNA-directed DNA polymerase